MDQGSDLNKRVTTWFPSSAVVVELACDVKRQRRGANGGALKGRGSPNPENVRAQNGGATDGWRPEGWEPKISRDEMDT